jgi:hypothetical protein
MRVDSGIVQLLGDRRALLVAHVAEQHLRARSREAPGCYSPGSAGGTCHDRHLSLKLSHSLPSLFVPTVRVSSCHYRVGLGRRISGWQLVAVAGFFNELPDPCSGSLPHPLAANEDTLEAFSPDGAEEALADGVHERSLRGGADHLRLAGLRHCAELRPELVVVVSAVGPQRVADEPSAQRAELVTQLGFGQRAGEALHQPARFG